jgi:hypothetical protein
VDPDAELFGQVGSRSEIIVADPNLGFDKKICIIANFSSKWSNLSLISYKFEISLENHKNVLKVLQQSNFIYLKLDNYLVGLL